MATQGIQVTDGLLMDLGWVITTKNGSAFSVEPPQDGKLLWECVYVSCALVYVSNPFLFLPGIRHTLPCFA